MIRTFEHPNGQRQVIDTDLNAVWVHPRAKKKDFAWRKEQGGLFKVQAKMVHFELAGEKQTLNMDAINKYCREQIMEAETDGVLIPALPMPQEDDGYDEGYRAAIAKCYCPGATIEMAHRVQLEATRLGL
jgi:hypothetical protein